MADAAPSVLEILIDIRARLEAVEKTQAGLRAIAQDAADAHQSASELGSLFATGLGIGSGMEMARRAVELFRSSFTEAVRVSSQLAAEVERAHGRLGLSGEAYQTLASEARAAGTEFSEIMGSMAQFRAQLGDTLLDPTRGSALRQLGLDAQLLASTPLERQLEQIAVALGKVTDTNVRARLQQELFGRGAAAMAPLLEKLRTDGYDRLRQSAQEANTVLGDGTAEAINRANTKLEEAQKRLGVAVAPLNLKLIEAKTQLVSLIARNAGTIQSAVEASFAGSLAAGIEKALERVEKSGGLEAALKNLGKTLAGPIGVGLATALGGFIIKELERRALEATERINSLDEGTKRELTDFRQRITGASSQDELQRTMADMKARFDAINKERRGLIQTPFLNDEQHERIEILTQALEGLSRIYDFAAARGGEFVAKNGAVVNIVAELAKAEAKLADAEATGRVFDIADEARAATDAEVRRRRLYIIEQELAAYKKLIEIKEKLPLKVGDTPEQRAAEIAKLRAAVNELEAKKSAVIMPASDLARVLKAYGDFLTAPGLPVFTRTGATRLTGGRSADGGTGGAAGGEGGVQFTALQAGAMQWVTSLGSQGQQVANALQNSIGATVHSISEGIYGWVTGTQSWADTLRGLGQNLLQTFLDTIVQMGVQWVINSALAKGSLISTFLVAAGLRKAETADVIANETAKAPALQTNAASASVSSFGLAAVMGIAALLAVMAAFGGFRESGGDVRAGRAYVVGEKRPEVFVPDENGTIIPSLDNVPVPAAARARPVNAGAPVGASAALSNVMAAPQQQPRPVIAFAENYTDIRRLKRQPGWEDAVVVTVQNRLGDILGG